MLEQFTWQQFTLCITGISAIYYAAVSLLYYRKDLNDLFSGKPKRRESLEDYSSGNEDDILLGDSAEEGFISSSMEDLHFPTGANTTDQQILLGQIPDLLEEFKTLISITSETGESKGEFLSLFSFIISKYPAAKRNNYRDSVNSYVLESSEGKFSFSFSEEDLNNCWDQTAYTPPRSFNVPLIIFWLCNLFGYNAFAQDGNAGINEATNKVKSYFDTGTDLMYAVGAVVGLIGAIKVYQKWNAGEPDTGKVASAWFGSCIFLVVVATVLKSFFGI